MVKTIIMIVYVIICIALTIIVLSQEGKISQSDKFDYRWWI